MARNARARRKQQIAYMALSVVMVLVMILGLFATFAPGAQQPVTPAPIIISTPVQTLPTPTATPAATPTR